MKPFLRQILFGALLCTSALSAAPTATQAAASTKIFTLTLFFQKNDFFSDPRANILKVQVFVGPSNAPQRQGAANSFEYSQVLGPFHRASCTATAGNFIAVLEDGTNTVNGGVIAHPTLDLYEVTFASINLIRQTELSQEVVSDDASCQIGANSGYVYLAIDGATNPLYAIPLTTASPTVPFLPMPLPVVPLPGGVATPKVVQIQSFSTVVEIAFEATPISGFPLQYAYFDQTDQLVFRTDAGKDTSWSLPLF